MPIGPYFIDFLCVSQRLVVEVDGEGHEKERDERKTNWLEHEGYRVIRIPTQDVDESIDDVIHGIYLQLAEPWLPTRISPPGGALPAPPTSPLRGEA